MLGRIHTTAAIVAAHDIAMSRFAVVIAYNLSAAGVKLYLRGIAVIKSVAVAAIHDDDRLLSDADFDHSADAGVPFGYCGQISSNSQVTGFVVLGGMEQIALKITGFSVTGFLGDRPVEVAVFDIERVSLIARGHIKICDLTIGQIDRRIFECNLIRCLNMNGRFANHLVALIELHDNGAGLLAGGEDAAARVDRAHAVVLERPGESFRQIDVRAGAVNAKCGERYIAAGRIVLAVRGERCVVKHAARLRRGNNHQRTGNRAFNTIGNTVFHSKLAGAFTLGQHCCRAAAVKVQSIHAAEITHDFCKFVECQTDRLRGLTTVIHIKNNATVFLDTHGTAGIQGGIRVQTLGDFAVANEDITSGGRLEHIVTDGGLAVADLDGAVLQDREVTPAGSGVVIFHTVHDQRAVRLAGRHIEEAGVDNTDHVSVGISLLKHLFCNSGLVSKRLHSPSGAVVIFVSSFQ